MMKKTGDMNYFKSQCGKLVKIRRATIIGRFLALKVTNGRKHRERYFSEGSTSMRLRGAFEKHPIDILKTLCVLYRVLKLC